MRRRGSRTISSTSLGLSRKLSGIDVFMTSAVLSVLNRSLELSSPGRESKELLEAPCWDDSAGVSPCDCSSGSDARRTVFMLPRLTRPVYQIPKFLVGRFEATVWESRREYWGLSCCWLAQRKWWSVPRTRLFRHARKKESVSVSLPRCSSMSSHHSARAVCQSTVPRV